MEKEWRCCLRTAPGLEDFIPFEMKALGFEFKQAGKSIDFRPGWYEQPIQPDEADNIFSFLIQTKSVERIEWVIQIGPKLFSPNKLVLVEFFEGIQDVMAFWRNIMANKKGQISLPPKWNWLEPNYSTKKFRMEFGGAFKGKLRSDWQGLAKRVGQNFGWEYQLKGEFPFFRLYPFAESYYLNMEWPMAPAHWDGFKAHPTSLFPFNAYAMVVKGMEALKKKGISGNIMIENPCCGHGTLGIMAGQLAEREFSNNNMKITKILFSDLESKFLEVCESNAEMFHVKHFSEFHCRNEGEGDSSINFIGDLILVNPPFGYSINHSQIEALHIALINRFYQSPQAKAMVMITPHFDLVKEKAKSLGLEVSDEKIWQGRNNVEILVLS